MKNRKARKNGIIPVNISFKENEIELLEYADNQGGFSKYVKELIRKDMNKTTEVNLDDLKALLTSIGNVTPKEEKTVSKAKINKILGLKKK